MEHEPPDLADLSEDDQHREVFAWAGLALHQAQVVEHGLVNVLLMARLSDPELGQEFTSTDAFFSAHFRLMMGRLLHRLRLHVSLPTDLADRLDQLIWDRNFIVHGFFRERNDLFVHEGGRAAMLQELATFVQATRDVDRELEELVLSLGTKFGITRERVSRMAAELAASARANPGL